MPDVSIPNLGERKLARRYCAVTALVLAVVLPLMTVALLGLNFANDDVQPWFPDDTPEREVYAEFVETFGVDDFALLALDGADGTNDVVLGALSESLGTEGQANGLIESVEVLRDPQGGRSRLLLKSSPAGARDRAEVYAAILSVADQTLETEKREQLRVTGPVFMGASAAAETEKTMRMVAPLTALFSVMAALLLLRNFRLAMIAFGTSSLAAMGSLAVIHFTKGNMSNMLNIVPSIAQLLAMSNAVHLIHYYCDCSDEEVRSGNAWLMALRKGLKPTLAASVTTMIGLGSLYVSPIPVVREFAIYGALGVICSMLGVLLVVPVAIYLLRPAPHRGDWLKSRVTQPLCGLTARRSWTLSLVLGCLAIVMGCGLVKLGPEVRMETLFSKNAKFSKDLAWFRDEFGPVQPCEVLFRFPADTSVEQSVGFFGVLEKRFATEALDGMSLFSPAVVGQMLPDGPEKVISALRADSLVASSESSNDLWWRATVRHIPDPDPTDSETLRTIRAIVTDSVDESAVKPTWDVTGSYQLFATAQAGLLGSLLRSFFVAVLLIAPLTMLFLKSFRLGAIAMLGNVFPLVVFFGALGWLGVRIDIATMMIASVAFGVAVDDTIHFLNWFAHDQKRPITERVRKAFSHSAGAIIQTTLIISIGMLAFAFSDFNPSRRFALFTSIVLGLAVVGDLLFLPSLLQGPFRRFFNSRSEIAR